ncbi:unnamed protein product [Symbiodinium sp. CCMP2592]|nr:unnamed protein product [Symbiodinium sp. CCMP2592]
MLRRVYSERTGPKPCAFAVDATKHAKVEQDRKDRELHEVADPHCEVVASAETGIRTEIRLLQRLKMSLWKKDDLEKVWEVGGLLASWGEDLPDQVSEAELVNQELDSPERQLRLEQLLRQNADPNAPDRLGSTALLCAAAAGHPELIQPLLDARAQVEVHSRFGATALMGAARAGHLEVVEALVKARAQLEARNERGDTALLVAATNGQLKVVESLLTAGAQLEARRDIGTTALMLSSIQGHLKVVEALVRAGAQLDARDGHGLTALRMAARGANTAVEAARFGGHPEVVEVLRKAGAQY